MKKNSLILSTSLIMIIFLAGCSTMPPADFTVQNLPSVERKNVELVSITVGYVAKTRGVTLDTNHLVPPAWETALQDAINRSLIFKDDQDRNISISVRIDHFDLPAAGFAMTSDCGAIYEITDRSSGEIVFRERIYASGTTPLDYAFAGVFRMAESVNRCARNNIVDFLVLLDQRDL
jgi:hypothetical protein